MVDEVSVSDNRLPWGVILNIVKDRTGTQRTSRKTAKDLSWPQRITQDPW